MPWNLDAMCPTSYDDFDEPLKSQIKAFLGPWPRALEAAGLKEAKIISEKPKKKKKKTKNKARRME